MVVGFVNIFHTICIQQRRVPFPQEEYPRGDDEAAQEIAAEDVGGVVDTEINAGEGDEEHIGDAEHEEEVAAAECGPEVVEGKHDESEGGGGVSRGMAVVSAKVAMAVGLGHQMQFGGHVGDVGGTGSAYERFEDFIPENVDAHDDGDEDDEDAEGAAAVAKIEEQGDGQVERDPEI